MVVRPTYLTVPLSGGKMAVLIPDDATGLSTDDFCRAVLCGAKGDVILPSSMVGDDPPDVPGYTLFLLIGPPSLKVT